MTIDWAHFTPFSALAGGALEINDAEAPWRWSLIVGLVRLSPRSFVATGIFIAAGMLICRAAAGRRLPGLRLLAQDA